MDLRFKRSVVNAVHNIVAKEKTRRRNVPTVSIGQEPVPGGVGEPYAVMVGDPEMLRRIERATAMPQGVGA